MSSIFRRTTSLPQSPSHLRLPLAALIKPAAHPHQQRPFAPAPARRNIATSTRPAPSARTSPASNNNNSSSSINTHPRHLHTTSSFASPPPPGGTKRGAASPETAASNPGAGYLLPEARADGMVAMDVREIQTPERCYADFCLVPVCNNNMSAGPVGSGCILHT